MPVGVLSVKLRGVLLLIHLGIYAIYRIGAVHLATVCSIVHPCEDAIGHEYLTNYPAKIVDEMRGRVYNFYARDRC